MGNGGLLAIIERDKRCKINAMEYELSLQKLIMHIKVIGFEIIGN